MWPILILSRSNRSDIGAGSSDAVPHVHRIFFVHVFDIVVLIMSIRSLSAVLSLLAFIVMSSSIAISQIPYSTEQFRVFDGKGDDSGIDAIISAAANTDVLFLGETHDDAVAHAIQLELFRLIIENYGKDRRVVLSMEMFERDVQVVVDEFLNGLIREDHFMMSSRPWGNFKTDYKPLFDLAKEKKLEVIAANAPRRYVNMVSRNGRQALAKLSPAARTWLPPLPYAEASPAYTAKFRSLMGGSSEAMMGLDNILSSQSLWDASMAYWISRSLAKDKRGLVVHLNGLFHTESRLGTVEHLMKYRPKARAIVVTMRPENEFRSFDQKRHSGIGDFVILTDASVPRSKR